MPVRDTINYHDLEGLRVGRFNLGVNSTFVVYRLGGTVFDTGPSNQWRYVKPFIQERPLEQLLLTHHHEDHSGNAAAIKAMTGVTPLAPVQALDKLRQGYRVPLMQRVIWGGPTPVEVDALPEELALESGEPVVPIHAPGHARDMTCYLLPERGWLMSADLYIANHLKMLRIDEHLPTLIESTQNVLAHDFDTVICPHRGIVEDGPQKLREKVDYLVNLAGEVQTLSAKGVALPAIMERLLGKETPVTRLTGNNFSKINLVRACLDVVT